MFDVHWVFQQLQKQILTLNNTGSGSSDFPSFPLCWCCMIKKKQRNVKLDFKKTKQVFTLVVLNQSPQINVTKNLLATCTLCRVLMFKKKQWKSQLRMWDWPKREFKSTCYEVKQFPTAPQHLFIDLSKKEFLLFLPCLRSTMFLWLAGALFCSQQLL